MVTATIASRKAAPTKARANTAAKTKVGAKAHAEDAIAILTADHAKVKKLFKKYDKLTNEKEKQAVATEICTELTVHAKVEEEIFYPAVRQKIKDQDMMNEAVVEHGTAKDLIAQIEGMTPSDPMYDAKVIVLGEYIDHHVKEEQDEMFPKAKKAKLDMVELGQRIKMRKQELMRSMVH